MSLSQDQKSSQKKIVSVPLCGKQRQGSADSNLNFKTCLKMIYNMVSFLCIMLTSFTFIRSFLCAGDC